MDTYIIIVVILGVMYAIAFTMYTETADKCTGRLWFVVASICIIIIAFVTASIVTIMHQATRDKYYEKELEYKYAHKVCTICNERDEQD